MGYLVGAGTFSNHNFAFKHFTLPLADNLLWYGPCHPSTRNLKLYFLSEASKYIPYSMVPVLPNLELVNNIYKVSLNKYDLVPVGDQD